MGSRSLSADRTLANSRIKRLADLLVAAFALAVLAPLIAVVALTIRWNLGSPILFRQQRPGLKGKPFHLYKFRSMRDVCDADGVPLSDAERLTPFGCFIRSTSLDELPSLWNVVVGDLSFVGPRPLLMEYLPLYDRAQARRHEVRPGITGWAQVNGRNTLSWSDKFALDVWYVDNRSTLLDLRILAMTVMKVIRRDGISADGEATMSKFTGNEDWTGHHK